VDYPWPALPLPEGIRARTVDDVNGLQMHLLEAGFETEGRSLVLLLHGFPELAYSWRRIMPALAAAGYWVVAPDQRGYGRTAGWDWRYDGDPESFWMLNLVQDIVALTAALKVDSVAAVVGHDFGSPVAAWCALMQPGLFHSVIMMSAPFGGPPRAPVDGSISRMERMQRDLARLRPSRKHYHGYYATPEADADMRGARQGIHAFLRAYHHVKSADWAGNQPHELKAWTAKELAQLPTYYVMNLHEGMAQTVAREAPSIAQVKACHWLTEDELRVYACEFARTGFQGGLLWYRGANDTTCIAQLASYHGRAITVPACFIAGKSDWGTYQTPGALQAMTTSACADFRGLHLVEGAGHWVQQEQSAIVSDIILEFLRTQSGPQI
jgi:pimeloyl-ACP methyl ester carboxylesterase